MLYGFKCCFSFGGVFGRGVGLFVGMLYGGEFAIRGFYGADVGVGFDVENVVEFVLVLCVVVFDGVIF